MKGRVSRVGDLCQQPLTYGGVLAEEGAVKMFLRGRPVPMLIPDELAPTYSLDTRSELPSCRLKLDWVYPFALFFLPHLTYPPHHHPPPQPEGTKALLVWNLSWREGLCTEGGASQAFVA